MTGFEQILFIKYEITCLVNYYKGLTFWFIVDVQKNKIESAVSRTSETFIRKSDISLPLSSVTTNEQVSEPIPKEQETPVIKRKQKEPRPEEVDVMNQLKDICFLMNPNEIYKDMVKIGQGFVYIDTFFFF